MPPDEDKSSWEFSSAISDDITVYSFKEKSVFISSNAMGK